MVHFGIGEAESKVLLTSTIDMKRFTNDKGYLLTGGFPQQAAGTHITG